MQQKTLQHKFPIMPVVQGVEPDLRAVIQERFGTAHKFCKVTGLPRATVYQVLAGRYAGNMQRQAARIQSVLEGEAQSLPAAVTIENLGEVLANTACSLCIRKGRCTRRRNKRCAAVHRAQARAVSAMLRQFCEGQT